MRDFPAPSHKILSRIMAPRVALRSAPVKWRHGLALSFLLPSPANPPKVRRRLSARQGRQGRRRRGTRERGGRGGGRRAADSGHGCLSEDPAAAQAACSRHGPRAGEEHGSDRAAWRGLRRGGWGGLPAGARGGCQKGDERERGGVEKRVGDAGRQAGTQRDHSPSRKRKGRTCSIHRRLAGRKAVQRTVGRGNRLGGQPAYSFLRTRKSPLSESTSSNLQYVRSSTVLWPPAPPPSNPPRPALRPPSGPNDCFNACTTFNDISVPTSSAPPPRITSLFNFCL